MDTTHCTIEALMVVHNILTQLGEVFEHGVAPLVNPGHIQHNMVEELEPENEEPQALDYGTQKDAYHLGVARRKWLLEYWDSNM